MKPKPTSKNYIKFIRSFVGHRRVLMNFVMGVIFNDAGEILLQKRFGNGKWGLPGGTMELGETFTKTLSREVEEETCLKVKAIKLLGIYSGRKYYNTHPNGDKTQPVTVVFYVKVIGGKLKIGSDNESLDLKFFSKENLPEIASKAFFDIINDALERKDTVWK